jgi:hypothetical protein
LSADLKARILQAIEAALAPLPVDELPEAELVQIAEGIRDRINDQAVAAQEAAAARLRQKQALQKYGLEYAQAELRGIEDLDVTERWRIEALVKYELESIRGDESRTDVKALVDEFLDVEGFEIADEDDTEASSN